MAKDKIRRGHEFPSREEKFWEALADWHGVVVIGLGTRGFKAYDCSYDLETEEGEKALRQNFAGAKYNHERNVFLVTRENGRLVWRTEAEPKPEARKKFTAVLPWRARKFHFSESDNDVA